MYLDLEGPATEEAAPSLKATGKKKKKDKKHTVLETFVESFTKFSHLASRD